MTNNNPLHGALHTVRKTLEDLIICTGADNTLGEVESLAIIDQIIAAVPETLTDEAITMHRRSLAALALELPASVHATHSLIAVPIHEAAALLNTITAEKE